VKTRRPGTPERRPFFAKNAAAPTDTDLKNDQVMNFRFFGVWVLCSLYI
jgi:hypothetical protein